MAYEITKIPYTGDVRTVTLGVGEKSVTIGGETAYPFHLFEGEMPNPPKIAMEVWDMEPDNWPEAAKAPFKDVITDPASWAKKCVDEYGADIVVLQLKSTDPNGMNRGADEAIEVVKKVLDSIDVPLVVWGTANSAKDEEVLKKISEECEGKNLALAPVEEGNHKGVGASALGYGHVIVASTPIDVNLAKQLNILLGNLGVQIDRILIDPTTGGLGYGLEYSYSVMERIRMAALTQEDDKLQVPIINNLGNEIWKCKEAGLSIEEAPTLGDPEKRAILMESVAAVCYLLAGSDVVVLRHPESVRLTRSFVELMINGGMALDVPSITKNLEIKEVDLAAIAPEPKIGVPEEEPAKKEPAKPKKEKPKVIAEAKKEEPPIALKPEEEAKVKAEEEAKKKAEEEARKKAEAEARAKAEEEAKVKAEEEAKKKAEEEARKKAEEKAREKKELLELRYKRALEREKLEAERAKLERERVTKTPAKEQKSLVDKLMENLDRIHRRR